VSTIHTLLGKRMPQVGLRFFNPTTPITFGTLALCHKFHHGNKKGGSRNINNI